MYDVITVGTASLDVYLKSPLFRVVKDPHFTAQAGFPEGEAECFALGSKIDVEELIIETGGGATNAAVTFAQQGLRVGSVVKLGNDSSAALIRNVLRQSKVQAVVIPTKTPTAYSTILLAPTGERTILVFRGSSDHFKTSEIAKALHRRTRWYYVIPGRTPVVVLERFLGLAKRSGANVAINPSYYHVQLGLSRLKKLLQAVDVLILNREEASLLTRVSYERMHDMVRKLDKAVSGIVVVTDGKRGVFVSDGSYVYETKSFKEKKVVDKTGAGDAFGSAFVATLIRSAADYSQGDRPDPGVIREAIRVALANATSVIERLGAKHGLLTLSQLGAPRWQHAPTTKRLLAI